MLTHLTQQELNYAWNTSHEKNDQFIVDEFTYMAYINKNIFKKGLSEQ